MSGAEWLWPPEDLDDVLLLESDDTVARGTRGMSAGGLNSGGGSGGDVADSDRTREGRRAVAH